MTTTDDTPVLEYCPPIERKPGHLTIKTLTDRCHEVPIEWDFVYGIAKKCIQEQHLTPLGVDANDGRNPFLFGQDSALILKVMTTLVLTTAKVFGAEGPDSLGRAVSNALKYHNVSDHFPDGVPKGENVQAYFRQFGRNPASWVILDDERGVKGWSLHVRWFFDDDGQKRCAAKLWNVTTGFMPDFLPNADGLEALPHAEIIMPMDRILPILKFNRDRSRMN
uniref:hypothetical protein n=1 Tax=Pararhizobium sp. IMCC3301 TaxID=3067904 RepID=UPI002741BF07|nr:hypothetical protein [Pararhizobium sp. IMCC3301]